MNGSTEFIHISWELDQAGLIWYPEIGDEVSERENLKKISILVDPHGLTPRELRINFVWLPTVEQIVEQLEARQAIIYHAGINNVFSYETVVKTPNGVIEAAATTLRLAFGRALQEVLSNSHTATIH